jgi:hypothetical protein
VYGQEHLARTVQLFPIPPDVSVPRCEWSRVSTHRLRIVHTGSLHAFQAPNFDLIAGALAPLGGELCVVGTFDEAAFGPLLRKHANVRFVPPFAHSDDALAFMASEATACLVSYSFDRSAQPWGATSFPSRMIEYAHIGIPLLICAPPWAAVSEWADERQWPLRITTGADEAGARRMVGTLLEQSAWEAYARASVEVASRDFAPAAIQRRFEEALVLRSPTGEPRSTP